MYRTMNRAPSGNYVMRCPVCDKVTLLTEDLEVASSCPHYVRRWRVTADRRVRVEYRESTKSESKELAHSA